MRACGHPKERRQTIRVVAIRQSITSPPSVTIRTWLSFLCRSMAPYSMAGLLSCASERVFALWSESYHLTKEASRFIISSARDAVPTDLMSRAAAARRARAELTVGVVQDVPVTQRGRMTSRRADRRSDVPAPGRRTPSCPERLQIRTGSTRLLERVHATAERTGPCASNEKMPQNVSGSGPPFLASLSGETRAQQARMSV